MWRVLVLLACYLASAALGQSQQGTPPAFVLHDLGRASFPLDGEWQFHEGDDLAWASPGYDDSAWQPIRVGRSWEEQGHAGYKGFAWYRQRLLLKPEPSSGSARDWNLGLYLSHVDSACEVYWNGVKVGSFGKLPPHPAWQGFGGSNGVAMDLGPAQSGVLAIRVWKAPYVYLSSPNEGGIVSVPRVGSVEAMRGLQIEARYRTLKRNQFSRSVAQISAIVGLMALLFWWRNRRQRMLLWLSLAMVSPGAMYLISSIPDWLTFRQSYGLIGPLVAINDLAIWFLLIALLGLEDRPRLVRWTWILGLTALGLDLVDSISQLFDWTAWPDHLFLHIDVASTLPAIIIELWGLVLVISALRKRLDSARWLLVIVVLFNDLLRAVLDIGGLGERWTHFTAAEILEFPLLTIDGSPLNAQTIGNVLLLIAVLYAAWRYLAEQGQRQGTLELEMRNARAVQQVLIPDEIPSVPGFRIQGVYKPAGEVGGDFFQILPTEQGGVLVVIGDVSGKGMPAAMTVSLLVGTVRTLAHYTQTPGEILAAMNQRMLTRSQGGFTTCLVMRVDPDGSLVVANAGHLSPYRNGEEIQLENGLPLGLIAHADYTETRLQLEPQDNLTFLSDGVVEARNAAGELFGFDRTAAIASQPADEIASVAQHFGQEDDITVLKLSFAGEESPRVRLYARGHE